MGNTSSTPITTPTVRDFGLDAKTISDCRAQWSSFKSKLNVGSMPPTTWGGADRVDTYVSEGRIIAKGELVAKIADALRAGGLKIKESGSDDELVRAIIAAIPDPRKGRSFSADAKKQRAVCAKLARVFNDQFTPGAKGAAALIDPEAGAETICAQVAEFARSLTSAASAEFLSAYADIRLTFKKISIMREVMKNAYEHISKAAVSGEGESAARAAMLDEQYRLVSQNLDRLLAQLKNYMSNVIEPAEADLEKLMHDDERLGEELEALKLKVGTKDFGDRIAFSMLLLGSSSLMLAKIDAALKAVGMSASDYKRLGHSEELDSAIERLEDKKEFSGTADHADFLKAAGLLKAAFPGREEVMGGCGCDGEPASDMPAPMPAMDDVSDDLVEGGADSADKLDKRIRKMKEEKKLVLTSFNRRVRKHFDDLLKAVSDLGPHLGAGIPLNSRTDTLRDALLRIRADRALSMKQIYFALSGYIRDSAAREEKETFLANLRMVRDVLKELMTAEGYGSARKHLEPMVSAIDGIVGVVTSYSEEVERTYRGRGETSGVPDSVVGAADDDIQLPNIARSAIDLKEAIDNFQYFYYVARIKENLHQTHKELESYGEGYAAKLADAIGGEREAVRGAAKALKDALGAVGVPGAPGPPGAARAPPAGTTPLAPLSDYAGRIIDEIADCRDEFWRAIEAIDLYLMEFTRAITAHPDDVKSIASMLDDTVVIARWFREETGDDFCRAFECMPTAAKTSSKVLAKDAADADKGIHDVAPAPHYYKAVSDANGVVGNVTEANNLTTPVGRARAEQAKKYLDRAMSNFQALKNLMSVVTTIGDKIGDGFSERMIMSPAQIYDRLLNFLKCAAFSTEIKNGTLSVGFANVTNGYMKEYNTFARAIKALSAKVLTVLGAFDMFEKPGKLREIGPVRMIMGGAEYGPPKVVPEATELYYRLTLLAEFYKEIFKFDEGSSASSAQISMIPEVEGVFSGLIYTIFDRAQYAAQSGNYTPDDLRAIVREINAIYRHFSGSGKDATSAAIHAFVAEINRRYGIVSKDQWTKWTELRKSLRNTGQYSSGPAYDTTDIAILRGEGSKGSRFVGSDRFVNRGVGAAGAPGAYRSKYSIGDTPVTGSRALIAGLLDKVYEKVGAGPQGTDDLVKSYRGLIERARGEIRRATTDEEKFEIVRNLIQGGGEFSRPNLAKLVAFHETVVVGLNVLGAMQSMIRNFINRVALIKSAGSDNDKIQGAVNALYGMSCLDGVTVSIRFPKGKDQSVYLDFSGLKNTISTLMSLVRTQMNSFRPHLDEATIARYEARSGGAVATGTFYDLEEEFDLVLFGRDGPVAGTVDGAAIDLDKAIRSVTGDVSGAFIPLIGAGESATAPNDLAGLFTVPASKGRSNLPDEAGPPGSATTATPVMNGVLADDAPTNQSLLSAFNWAAHAHLKGNLDASNKIYAGLINSFVNGPLSAAVMSGAKAGTTGFAAVDDANPTLAGQAQPLYASNIRAYYRAYMSMANATDKQHLYLDLIDVPAHMKETYRVNLSLMLSQLDAIIRRGDFLKEFVRNSGLTVNGADDLVQQADLVLRGVYSLKGACEQVIRELGDEPVFFETYSGSIADYRKRQGKLPVMPFSGLLAGLDATAVGAFAPLQTSGTNDFKFAYGTRGLLSGALGGRVAMPGVDEIIAASNSVSSSKARISPEEAKKYYGTLLPVVQCLVGTARYKKIFGSFSPVLPTGVIVNDSTLSAVLDTAEASDQSRVLENLTKNIASSRSEPGQSDRDGMRSRNIADLNIMPIDVHAMMREAPLANIYNYEYTFDKMLTMMFGLDDGSLPVSGFRRVTSGVIDSAKAALMSLLTDPYRAIDTNEYGIADSQAPIGRIFRGLTGLGMGRPKFLSDQIYGKVMFQNVFGALSDPSGPVAKNVSYYELVYLDGKDPSDATMKPANVPNREDLAKEGKARFDTAIIRSLFFVSNIQRVLRGRLLRELSEYRNVLSRKSNIVNPNVTEYPVGPGGSQSYSGMDEQLKTDLGV